MRIVWWILGIGTLAVAVYGLHRWLLYLERRGYIYYLEKPKGGGIASSMLELDKLTRPSVEHVIEAHEFHAESQEHDGE